MAERAYFRIPEDVVEVVRRLHPELERKVRAALDAIIAEPEIGKALRADLAGLRSLRVGRIRIIYKAGASLVDVVAIGPRATIYEETSRRIARSDQSTKAVRARSPAAGPRRPARR